MGEFNLLGFLCPVLEIFCCAQFCSVYPTVVVMCSSVVLQWSAVFKPLGGL